MESFHPTYDDFERYHLGMLKDENERAILEEHLIACPDCVDQAEAVQRNIDQIRIALGVTFKVLSRANTTVQASPFGSGKALKTLLPIVIVKFPSSEFRSCLVGEVRRN